MKYIIDVQCVPLNIGCNLQYIVFHNVWCFKIEVFNLHFSETKMVNSWPVSPVSQYLYPDQQSGDQVSSVPGQVPGLVDSIPVSQHHLYTGDISEAVPGYGDIVGDVGVHSKSYTLGAVVDTANESSDNDSAASDWSQEMTNDDEFAWSVQQYDNSINSNRVIDNRLTQDYDDIDYTSGNLVSFHTSIAK